MAPNPAQASYNKLQMKNVETAPLSVFNPMNTMTAGSLTVKKHKFSEPRM